MQAFFDQMKTLWQQFVGVLLGFRLSDAIDIIVVAFIIYSVIKLLRETRAAIFIKGIAIIVFIRIVAVILNLDTINWMMEEVIFQYGIFTLLIVFQPELRRILESLGRSSLTAIRGNLSTDEKIRLKVDAIDAVCTSCRNMSNAKIGALIVFERQVLLGDVVSTGTVINANPSSEMIQNIFFPKAPLHDGAMIIREGNILAAACILPLTSKDVNRELGTRHRAAIGMSENSDAIVVIVSEETGTISVASNGVIKRDYSIPMLKSELEKALLDINGEDDAGNNKKQFWKGWLKK